eukprot:TRINITY_DN8185_c0_g1_i1.p1 TRINITY_DN8185_c0_g1~~TRINITY_DN8185_c0_g1_i1.p1  ORF type:complete len:546 (+),score=148.27 TRINITY_DN8185_c0_g1_i1:204-1640(+)
MDQAEHDFREAIFALAGPHISLIAAFKVGANTMIKGQKLNTSQTNRLLSSALQAVNAINHAWKFAQQYPFLLFNVVKLLEDGDVKSKLQGIHTRMVLHVQQAQSFSEGARMKVAEESFETKLKVPKGKAFRGILRSAIFQAGPCIRSEVVFRHKGKAIGKVPKAQPMRLSVFGELVVLTASTLDAESLVIPPTALVNMTARSDPKLPADVFELSIRGGEVEFQLRCKHGNQADQWIKFFNSNGQEAQRLLSMHANFRSDLAVAERSRANTPVKALYDEDTNLSLLTHRAHHPTTRPSQAAWGSDANRALSPMANVQRPVPTPAAKPVDNEDDDETDAYLEITGDTAAAAAAAIKPNPSTSSWVSFEDGAPSSRLMSESQDADLVSAMKATDPFAAADPFANEEELSAPPSPKVGGLLPPPVNSRPKQNAPPSSDFKPDFDSPTAQKALTGAAVRRIPVKPLKTTESMADVFSSSAVEV